MTKVLILGAGLVGGPAALDLIRDQEYEIKVVDVNEHNLDRFRNIPLETACYSVLDFERLDKDLSWCDMVLNAVPGSIGYNVLKHTIGKVGKVIDIAFYPENALELDEMAMKAGSCVVCDMGVAPGMSHLLAAASTIEMDKALRIRILVGGLPKIRILPFEYKAVFSPADVLEEYTRPARFVQGGKIVSMPALSGREFVDFEKAGTLEAFNSDGLRSLISTMDVPDMIEKTLRYPGHAGLMDVLSQIGFFSDREVLLGNTRVKPIELTSALLFDKWKLAEGEEDFTVMRIEVEGIKDAKNIKIQWELFDVYDREGHIHSMARTTAYAATAALRLIDRGHYTRVGINPPEYLGKDPACTQFILNDQRRKGIHYVRTETASLS